VGTDLRFEREAEESVPVGAGRRAFAYVVDGTAALDGKNARAGEAAATENAPSIVVRGAAGARVWVAAAPHRV
jgi:redox-sensitive bicupin YhaK (pirin superfamily)